MGTVEQIGWRSTRVRSLSGELLIFPNNDLLKSRIRNSKPLLERRMVFSIGVTYQTPVEKVGAIPGMLRQTIESHNAEKAQVRFDRAHLKQFGDFALVYEAVYLVLSPDYNLSMDIQQAINLAVMRRFEQEGIQFAYPTQTVFVEQGNSNGTSPGAA
jgi:small-conductance mechanosensitive channel